MNIAIIIGVSKYSDSKNNLPACMKDVTIMRQILNATGKYEEILYLAQDSINPSAKVKKDLTSFIEKYQKEDIEEVFYYYTGHGAYIENEFYYIMSDYDSQKKRQTSLENSELDNLLRSLGAKLTVKVVDACQSGVEYIKSNDVIEKYLNSTKQTFKNCYFMFSSQNTEPSYQDENLSFFTRSFVESILSHGLNEIRYKDIISSISDYLQSNTNQMPFFVVQADYTEKFSMNVENIKRVISLYNKENSSNNSENKSSEKTEFNLVSLIKKESEAYFDKSFVEDLLEKITEVISKHKYSENFNELYSTENEFRKEYVNIPELEVIGRWLKENNNNFFARPTHREVEDKSQLVLTGLFGNKFVQKISGVEITTTLPYKAISIDACPKLANLIRYNCTIVFLVSKKDIGFFWFYTDYEECDWNKYSLNNNVKWTSNNLSYNNLEGIKAALVAILRGFEEYIITELNEMYKSRD